MYNICIYAGLHEESTIISDLGHTFYQYMTVITFHFKCLCCTEDQCLPSNEMKMPEHWRPSCVVLSLSLFMPERLSNTMPCLHHHSRRLTGTWQLSDNHLTGSTRHVSGVWRKRWCSHALERVDLLQFSSSIKGFLGLYIKWFSRESTNRQT